MFYWFYFSACIFSMKVSEPRQISWSNYIILLLSYWLVRNPNPPNKYLPLFLHYWKFVFPFFCIFLTRHVILLLFSLANEWLIFKMVLSFRLSHEWLAYVARTHSLRKTFISVKGIYYQVRWANCTHYMLWNLRCIDYLFLCKLVWFIIVYFVCAGRDWGSENYVANPSCITASSPWWCRLQCAAYLFGILWGNVTFFPSFFLCLELKASIVFSFSFSCKITSNVCLDLYGWVAIVFTLWSV